ncbi:GntR family transcriptional regulator [Lentibacillus saliphilus]|uniref:GntR family transcriptional regulator n=1 Tax=Lentibacillus saliphilus TaxID=2737028 RepID=UPI001C2F5BB4|nr:GntR family transcriptional regulator [Lentibacillus saliphilus]
MDIILSNTSKEPLFSQIKTQIKSHIFSGALMEGDALPSMRALAKELQVSVITTKRAYEDLEQEGYLVSAIGRGTFVAGQQPHVLKEWQIREFENQLEAVIAKGKQIGLTKADMIERLTFFYEGDE